MTILACSKKAWHVNSRTLQALDQESVFKTPTMCTLLIVGAFRNETKHIKRRGFCCIRKLEYFFCLMSQCSPRSWRLDSLCQYWLFFYVLKLVFCMSFFSFLDNINILSLLSCPSCVDFFRSTTQLLRLHFVSHAKASYWALRYWPQCHGCRDYTSKTVEDYKLILYVLFNSPTFFNKYHSTSSVFSIVLSYTYTCILSDPSLWLHNYGSQLL